MRVRFLLAFLTAPLHAHAAVEGFDESFNGTGPYQSIDGKFDGLDVPGWYIEGDGAIDGGGYVVTNMVPDPLGPPSRDRLAREVVGRGSFVSRVRINDLYLGELDEFSPMDAEGRVVLEHRVGMEDRFRILLSESIAPDGQWVMSVRAGDVQIVENVVQGDDVSLSISFDKLAKMVTFAYDPDTGDASPAIEIGPIPYSGDMSEMSVVALSFYAAVFGRADGTVDHWSMTSLTGLPGDFNGDGILDAADIDQLSEQVRLHANDSLYDLNDDSLVNDLDRQVWVHDLKQTHFGDADLNGSFDSADLVQVLASGEYEDGVELNSTWITGDWDGDGDFTSGDLVMAMADGGYKAGAAAVPEPSGIMLAMTAAALVAIRRCGCAKTRRA
jgi:hypothetical protein